MEEVVEFDNIFMCVVWVFFIYVNGVEVLYGSLVYDVEISRIEDIKVDGCVCLFYEVSLFDFGEFVSLSKWL